MRGGVVCDGGGGSRSIMYTCFFTACAVLMVSVCICKATTVL